MVDNIQRKKKDKVINTWYLDNKKNDFYGLSFQGSDSCDTLIIGGGIAGLSLKHMLDANKISSILVEQKTIASGASGMNGGFCSSGWSLDQRKIEKVWETISKEAKVSLKKSNYMKKYFEKKILSHITFADAL